MRRKKERKERKTERDRLKHEKLYIHVILCKEIRVNHRTITVKETGRPKANVIYNVFIFPMGK